MFTNRLFSKFLYCVFVVYYVVFDMSYIIDMSMYCKMNAASPRPTFGHIPQVEKRSYKG